MLDFLNDVPVYKSAAAPELSIGLESLIAPFYSQLPVTINVVGKNGAFGVMHRQTEVNGNQIILMVNVSSKPVQVELLSKKGQAIDGYDMLNAESVKGNSINLPIQGVRLIKVSL